ncbi:hypothetical protein [Actinophytocola gossypii]|uniref:Uncharacterized protein n=1 Tax=Actinophytocola gossypii TaxID=2812003 RepID=A0ABT2JDZ8_9PSEU|nr:hypothetical protein [Actinophytocola gossypii]MCT2585991.1 hypothetical protein [Actinophytocola gossypii]
MTEQDVRDGLANAVAGEPPLRLDPDALMATARRQVRRRALVAVSLATAAVAVAAVTLPAAIGPRDDLAPAAPPVTTSTTTAPTPPPWPPPDVEPRVHTAAELYRRGDQMRAFLGDVAPTVLPGATDVEVAPFAGEAAGDVDDGQGYLTSFAHYTLDGNRFALGVNVYAPGAHSEGPDEVCVPDPDGCETLDTERGGQVLAVDVRTGRGDPPITILAVYHFRRDGSVVSVVGYDYDPAATLPMSTPPMPVTAEQLARLAVDPALGL